MIALIEIEKCLHSPFSANIIDMVWPALSLYKMGERRGKAGIFLQNNAKAEGAMLRRASARG